MSKKPSRTDFDPFDDAPLGDPLGDPFDDPFDAAPYPPPDAPDDAAITAALEKLAAIDLAALFGPDGALAGELGGYELRQSQLDMAEAVKRAILARQHALIEAPTGTGKSIAYLLPAILSGQTVVVSTANKSLQSQLYQKEIPFLRKVLGQPIPTVIVKGRSNFICNYKWEKETGEQGRISLYDREDEQFTHMRGWLATTATGDIDELPFVLSGDLRPRVVSFPDDCLHSDCRFYEDDCWINQMRDAAAQAQVIITNHHLLLNALELGYAGERILPPAPLYIIDEAHHLEQIATAVYEVMVSDYTVEQLLARTIFKEHLSEDELDKLRYLNTLAFQDVSRRSDDNAFQIEGDLESILKLSSALAELGSGSKRRIPTPPPSSRPPNRANVPPPTPPNISATTSWRSPPSTALPRSSRRLAAAARMARSCATPCAPSTAATPRWRCTPRRSTRRSCSQAISFTPKMTTAIRWRAP
jgi:ATP-dependent DNA helicase DinG